MKTEESPHQRVNRELIELLNELRVALPGVQVLFAFLLAVPFQQRFKLTTAYEHDVYFATLSLALVATALLIAPSPLHRLNFRRREKLEIVLTSNRLLLAGTAALALSMVGVMMLISSVLFGGAVAIVAPVLAGLLFAVLWVGLPLRARHRARPERPPRSA